MAEVTVQPSDFNAHKATYEGFINIGKISVVALLNVLLCLILFSFGGTAGTIFGWILMVALLIAAAVGIALGPKGWVPSAAVFGLSVLAAIVTAG
ncbi:aa3-type cytochrome c oxidase subunit IV [Stappia sp. F7233]|uniref:Aa3-type cytochrome c oxidase subunit IV n=1 Tax=Stappia albiluteola TaxID=2758565 RepID=A0A839AFH8_9HYPH|nr:aa3-type cytochrome c oxidase subunit IV [Stappia albiluteola]MBA5777309.1 aa3-type cytochrome c oxidase subunit IV [Stappia albiluteola]